MTALDTKARREGRKAMEKSLTPAGRVRRQLKAGRPRKILNVRLSTFDAMHRIVNEADRAREMMRTEGLDPRDIRLALIYCTPEKPDFQNAVNYKWLPEPGKTAKFFADLEKIAAADAVLYLGILWFQTDHDTEGKGVSWVTQFLAGAEAEKRLSAARDFFVSGGSKTKDN